MKHSDRRPVKLKKPYQPTKRTQKPLPHFSNRLHSGSSYRVKTDYLSKSPKIRKQRRASLACWAIECLALTITVILAVIRILGETAERFAGLYFFHNMLPFAIGVTVFIGITAGLLIAWSKLRYRLLLYFSALPATLATSIALISLCCFIVNAP